MVIYKKVYAFVDTSVLDPMYNDYSRLEKVLQNLKKHISNNKLILFTHEIAIREVEKHIRKDLLNKLNSYRNIQKCKELALLQKKKKYKNIFFEIDNDKAINDTIKEFKNILSNIGIRVIKTGNISIKNVLNDYFLVNPPFGENKKSEFPDAIMLESIKKKYENIDNIHILSTDPDWENVCKVNKYICHKTFSSLSDYLNRQYEVAEKIHQFLNEQTTQSYIESNVLKMIQNLSFVIDGKEIDKKGYVHGYDYEYSELKYANIIGRRLSHIEDISFKNIGGNDVLYSTILIRYNIRGFFDCYFNDVDNAIWDNEDKKYIYIDNETISEIHKLILLARIEIYGDKDLNLSVKSIDSVYTDENIELNSATLIKRIYKNYNNEDEFHYEKLFECPYCEKAITVELISDETECVNSEERTMGPQNEYNIDVHGKCPLCNCKYHVTGMLWEYPVGAYNYDSGLKIEKDEE